MIPLRYVDQYPEVDFELDASAVASKDELLALLGRALRLPPYYGNNWDALEECLRAVDAPTKLVVRGADALWRTIPREAAMLAEIVVGLAGEGIPLELVFVW